MDSPSTRFGASWLVVNLQLRSANPGGADDVRYELRSGARTLRLVILPGKGNRAKGQAAHWWDSTFTEIP